MKTDWPDKSFATLGLKATGVDIETSFITEICLSIFYERQNVWAFTWDITDDNSKEIMQYCMTLISRLIEYDLPLVVFNAPLNLKLLTAECDSQKVLYNLQNLLVIDPLILDRHYGPKKIACWIVPWLRFLQLKKRYGLLIPGLSAESVAKATGYIVLTQILSHKSIKTSSPKLLHKNQIQWYADWATEFARYCMNHGEDVIFPEWPLGEFPDWHVNDAQRELNGAQIRGISADCVMDSISSRLYGHSARETMETKTSAPPEFPEK